MTGILIESARWLSDGAGWLPILAAAVLKATVLLAGAGLLSLTLRRRSAAVRHFAWSVALFGCLLMPVLMMVLPTWTVPVLPEPAAAIAQQPSAAPGAADPAPFPGTRRVRRATTAGPDLRPDDASASTPARATESAISQLVQLVLPGATTLLALWGAVALVLVSRLVFGHLRVRRMARRTAGTPAWEPLARAIGEQTGLARMPRFVEGAAAAMPMTWGLFRPVVMVPSVAAEWPEARLRAVLLHELAHVKRSDCLTQTIAGLVCAAYWFNPLSWIAAARLRAERERACDDSVLAAGADGGDYAEQLLDIARAMRPAGLLSWATVSMARRSQLEGRLLAILDPDLPRRAPTRTAAVLAVFTLAVLVPTLAAVEAGGHTVAVAAGLRAGSGEAASQPGDAAILSPSEAARAATEATIRSATVGQVAGLVGGVVEEAADAFVTGSPGQRPMPRPMPTPTPTPTPRAGRSEEQREPVDQKVIDALMVALDDSDEDVRHQALITLARLGDPRATAPFVKALSDASPDVREQAAMALGRSRDPGAADALIKALSDQAPTVREHAVFALAQMREPRAVEPVIALVSDADADVREQAVFALSQLRDKRATPVVIKALADPDEDVRERAAFALSQLRDPEAVPALLGLLSDPKADVREQAVFALSQLRDARALPALTKATADADEDVREQAAFALSQIRDPAAVPALTVLLKDPKADVRRQAVFALGQLRDASSVEPLITALEDESPDVQRNAAFALGQLRDARAVDALLAALASESADVRQSAAFALGQIGDPKASDALTSALKDADADVRRAAAMALSHVIGGRRR